MKRKKCGLCIRLCRVRVHKWSLPFVRSLLVVTKEKGNNDQMTSFLPGARSPYFPLQGHSFSRIQRCRR